ncbi:MAG TPA: AAA family ATPase [Gemmatimonadales bacterium]|nr:AAA family ATPase [Gemmatimonadales bacterium]
MSTQDEAPNPHLQGYALAAGGIRPNVVRHPTRAVVVADVRLTLLGIPSVSSGISGGSNSRLSAKALGLLAYLALEPGPHTREELAGLLWGESSDAEARASLRQAIKQLRCQLGDALRCDRASLELSRSIECEVRNFREKIAQDPRLATTTDIPRFLTGCSVRHAPRFEEWVAETRRALLRQYQEALGTLARDAMGQWRWKDAIALADRWLASDPLSDEAARLGIEARYLAGDRGAALALYHDYRTTLMRETGCEPTRGLLNLARRVEADASSHNDRPITDEWYARAPSFEASLIGRGPEWDVLVEAWKGVKRGGSRVVLLEGEPGVGKSRLADEFLRWVVADGGAVLRGHGYDVRGGIPYEPVVELLRDALNAPGLAGTDPEWLTEVTRLLPELRQRFPSLPESVPTADPVEGWRLFEGVAQLLLSLSAERPLAIFVDDLQWCDSDSCNLLGFLVRRTEGAAVLWLSTISLGQLEREAPAARLCRALRAQPQATVLTIGPLTEENLWRMIREMGHVSTPTGARRLASRIFGVTGGNPFYVIELLKTMFAQGLLALDDETGEWTVVSGELSGPARPVPVSPTVKDVIGARVERLPDQLSDVLITIAVAGAGCPADVLSQVHGMSRLHAASVADALVDRRLVTEARGKYRCIHPVIAQVVRERLTSVRRQEVHRSLALALRHTVLPQEPGEASREIARHADRGGEAALAHEYALVAAQQAMERYAFAEAMSWLDLAAKNARSGSENDTVNRLTADVLATAGWTEPPRPLTIGGPVTRELVPEDFDLPASG